MATQEELERWDPGYNKPTGTPVNSVGMPYNATPMTAQELANERASMAALKAGMEARRLANEQASMAAYKADTEARRGVNGGGQPPAPVSGGPTRYETAGALTGPVPPIGAPSAMDQASGRSMASPDVANQGANQGQPGLTPPPGVLTGGPGAPGATATPIDVSNMPPPRARSAGAYDPAAPGARGDQVAAQAAGARFTLDARPYEWYRKNNPQVAEAIDYAAEQTRGGEAMKHRLALHAWLESGGAGTSPVGKAGEQGVWQIEPNTRRGVDPDGKYNPDDLKQGAVLAALVINDKDRLYGVNTPLSVMRYNGQGPGARAYLARASHLTLPEAAAVDRGETPNRATPQGVAQAAQQGGPPAVLQYMVETLPKNLTMSDKWRALEGMMVEQQLRRGNIEGAQKARQFVATLAYSGTNEHLKTGIQALQAGQGATAAQHFAAAHAFLPDGTQGRFWSDGRRVYVERADERDPTRNYGKSEVTLQSALGLLNQVQDPTEYMKLVQDQQLKMTQARAVEQRSNLSAVNTALAPLKFAQKQQELEDRNTRYGQGLAAQQERQDQNQEMQARLAEYNQLMQNYRKGTLSGGSTGDAQLDRTIAHEATTYFGGSDSAADPETSRKSVLFEAFRRNGMLGPEAYQQSGLIAAGLRSGDYKLQQSPGTGMSRINDKTGNTLVYLPSSVMQRFQGPQLVAPRPPAGQGPAPPARPQIPSRRGAAAPAQPRTAQPPSAIATASQYAPVYNGGGKNEDDEVDEEDR